MNLSKGRTGDLNSKLLGMIFVMKFQAAAMSRADVPEKDRVDFALYVDEFQNFSTDSFATIMSEARKYHLNLIVANQFTTQLTEEIRDAVFGNMGTVVAYRIGQNDVDSLSRYFQPQFDSDDLLRVPNYNSIVRTLVGGVPTQPFSMAALPPLGTSNPKLADALKQLSWAKYGKPRAKVEEDIFARLKTKDPAGPAFGSRPNFGAPGAQPGAQQFGVNGQRPATPPQAKPGSFLDDWLAKKQTSPNISPTSPTFSPPQKPTQTGSFSQPPTQSSVAPASMAPTLAPQQVNGFSASAPMAVTSVPASTAPEINSGSSQSQTLAPQATTMAHAQQTESAPLKTVSGSHEGEVNLRNKPNSQNATNTAAPQTAASKEDDGIYIDQDGNLKISGQVDV